MDTRIVINHIVSWLSNYVENKAPNNQTFVIGISGGIDSSLTSTLCAMTGKKTVVIMMPLHSTEMSLSKAHANFLSKQFDNVEVLEINLDEPFDIFKRICDSKKLSSDLGFANTKSRFRMLLLYQAAASYSGLVVGTGNKVEDFGVGFYTKYGDGGVDIAPIADLTKTEVSELAEALNIDSAIIGAPPSDGLWSDNRTDEKQLGLSYKEIEEAMVNDKSENREKYLSIRSKNLHKMEPIPVCYIDDKIKNN